jgi:hypothetical protein
MPVQIIPVGCYTDDLNEGRKTFMGIAKDTLSKEQKQEIERLRQWTVRMGLTALMNSTKWRKAIDAVTETLPSPNYRVKLVQERHEPSEWTAAFPAGLPLYNAIDWIEIDTANKKYASARETITHTWKAENIPHEMREGNMRLLGYAKR